MLIRICELLIHICESMLTVWYLQDNTLSALLTHSNRASFPPHQTQLWRNWYASGTGYRVRCTYDTEVRMDSGECSRLEWTPGVSRGRSGGVSNLYLPLPPGVLHSVDWELTAPEDPQKGRICEPTSGIVCGEQFHFDSHMRTKLVSQLYCFPL